VIVMNGGQVMYEGDKKEVFSHKKELVEELCQFVWNM
jgi:energy-coupling factor transport system ATP-binding protein